MKMKVRLLLVAVLSVVLVNSATVTVSASKFENEYDVNSFAENEGYIAITNNNNDNSLLLCMGLTEKLDGTEVKDVKVNYYRIKPKETAKIPLVYGSGLYRTEVYKYKGNSIDLEEIEITKEKYKVANSSIVWTASTYYADYENHIEKLKPIYNTLKSKSKTTFDYIKNVNSWVYNNIDYNWSTYKKMTSGQLNHYRPDIEKALNDKSGICQDHAYLVACLLRMDGIQAKVVNGEVVYADWGGHAWVEVLHENEWWISDATADMLIPRKGNVGFISQKYY